jgi:hypothetical protein
MSDQRPEGRGFGCAELLAASVPDGWSPFIDETGHRFPLEIAPHWPYVSAS